MLFGLVACGTGFEAEMSTLPVTVVITATAEEAASTVTVLRDQRPERRAERRATPDAPPTVVVSPTPLPPAAAAASPTSLLPTAPPATPLLPTATSGVTGSASCGRATVVGVTALSIRAAPTRQSTRLGEVSRGGSVELLCVDAVNADDRRWLRVRAGGIEGWMSDRYLAAGNATDAAGCGRATVVNVAALSIRAAPTRESTRLGEVAQGNQVVLLCEPEVAADDRIWWKVQVGALEGWMSNRYLQREEE
jgi:uncharacterized protein YraI